MLNNIRSTTFAGLATLVPLMLTFYFVRFLYVTFDQLSAPFAKKYLNLDIPGIGILITLILIYLLGAFTTNFLGKKIISIGETILKRVPLVSTIYSTLKQLTDTISKNSLDAFKGAVYLEYPRPGVWTMAFISGESKDSNDTSYYHLFVPTTPNPTSGFFLIIPKNDTVPSGMSVEDGLKTIISGGILAPKINPIRKKET
tara:strand:- start:3189 stop:3788 length:600 start_codon:yes stop_codon:yes gene_type:complete